MKGEKINVGVLAVIIVVSLFGGAAVGFLVTKLTTPSAKTIEETSQVSVQTQQTPVKQQPTTTQTEPKTNEVVNETKQEITPVASLNYDGSKTIDVNGKSYTVSYKTEKNKSTDNNTDDQIELKLFFNDKKVKSLKLYDVNDSEGVKGSFEVVLHNFDKDYVLVEVKTKKVSPYWDDLDGAHLVILNTDGECVESFEWDSASSIILKETGAKLTYEINSDSLVMYKITYNTTAVVVSTKYTVLRDIIVSEYLKTYKDGEDVSIAGK